MKSFNLRVYGILINAKNEILISDESRNGFSFTKFPGGGLEFGEGLADGLKREFQEEMEIDIEVGELFYVNEFHQVSAFNENHQLFSFYYFVKYENCDSFNAEKSKTTSETEGEQKRWVSLKEISVDDFTFPIDKIVCKKVD